LYICLLTERHFREGKFLARAQSHSHERVKRDLCVCQKRPIYMSTETYVYVKRDLYIFLLTERHFREGKFPAPAQGHSRGRVKRDLCVCQNRLIYMSLDRESLSRESQ